MFPVQDEMGPPVNTSLVPKGLEQDGIMQTQLRNVSFSMNEAHKIYAYVQYRT